MTQSRLWSDYDPAALPIDHSVSDETEENGITRRTVFFNSDGVGAGSVRVRCEISFAGNAAKNTAVVYAGDLFCGSDKDMTARLAEAGYLVVDPDFGADVVLSRTDSCADGGFRRVGSGANGGFDSGANGADTDANRTVYPEELDYCRPRKNSPYLLSANPSAKHSPWYVWAKILRRAAVLARAEYGAENVVLIGERSASTAAYIAGIDPSFSMIATFFGSGYISYDGIYKFGDDAPVIDDEMECFIAGVEAQTYARFIEKPVLMLQSTNSSLGDFDRASDLFGLFPLEKTMIVSPGLGNCVTERAAENLLKWIENTLAGKKPKATPIGALVISENNYYFNISVPDSEGIESLTAYYSTTDDAPYFREWRNARTEETERGEYIAKLEVAGAARIFAFANVLYDDGTLVSSKEYTMLLPQRASECDASFKNRVVYSGETGINFVPSSRRLTVSDGVELAVGAYGIKGVRAAGGGMINYAAGACVSDAGGDIAALQADVFTTESKKIIMSVYKKRNRTAVKYSCAVDVPGNAEWQRISIEPRMFKNSQSGTEDNFDGVKMLEIEDAAGVIFNNILFV